MAAYSVSIAVVNLSSSQVESRHDVMVERRDWSTALLKALQQVVQDLPSPSVVQKQALLDRCRDILAGVDMDTALHSPKGTTGL